MINFGNVWESELIRLWDESDKTVTEIARLLRVDPITVRRYAAKLNLSFNRIDKNYRELKDKNKLKLTSRVPKSDSKLLKAKKRKGFKCIGHIDWEGRDNEISLLVSETAQKIKNSPQRPRLITKTLIGRDANCLALLVTKLHKLPKTTDILKSVVDTDLTFAIRKINWVADDFRQRRIQLKQWQLIEIACLYRLKNIPIIKMIIEQKISSQNIDSDIELLA